MRARTVAAFLLGLAVGIICLGLGLWKVGGLRLASDRPVPAAGVQSLPDTEASRRFPAPASVPALPPASPPLPHASDVPATLNTADRMSEANRSPANDVPEPLAQKNLAFPVPSVDLKTVTDTFSQSRSGSRQHEALDIMAPRGTPVVAVDEGNVVKLFTSKQGGLTVYQFDNSGSWCYYYAHLDHYAPGLKEGTLLRKGDTLGYVGSTGDASPEAPHLHFAIFRLGPEKHWWQGTPVNPFPLFRP